MRDEYASLQTPFAAGVSRYFENYGYVYARHGSLAFARSYAIQHCPHEGTFGGKVHGSDAEQYLAGLAAADRMVQARVDIGHVKEPEHINHFEGMLWNLSRGYGTPYGDVDE